MWMTVKKLFSKIPEPKKPNSSRKIRIVDCLLSACAMFSFKFPSLLQFDDICRDEHDEDKKGILHNLKTLFGIEQVPSDTYMRERLDEVDHQTLRKSFTVLFAQIQRGKNLEAYQYLNGHYLISLDGSGHFSSNKVHCENCCEKHHQNGTITYHHQVLSAAIVHPDKNIPIPLCPEPIVKQDGNTKNDCERNASKRLLEDLRREHPHLKIIITEDGLASNAPHIKLLKSLKMHYILGAKPEDHKALFDLVDFAGCTHYEHIDKKGSIHRYRFVNNVSLNDSNPDCMVNFIEYWETPKKGRMQHFSWVTDIKITEATCYTIMKGGRARWHTENEIFNTLKNQGYEYEHNFGHGKKNLCTVFSILMTLAFLIDQIQLLCCPLFQDALKKVRAKIVLWQDMRGKFKEFLILCWEDLYRHIAGFRKKIALEVVPTTVLDST